MFCTNVPHQIISKVLTCSFACDLVACPYIVQYHWHIALLQAASQDGSVDRTSSCACEPFSEPLDGLRKWSWLQATARLKEKSGKMQQARQAYRRGIVLDPEHAPAYVVSIRLAAGLKFCIICSAS